MFITTELLESKDACEQQVALFRKLFPDGVEVTKELCIKHAHDFAFLWAAAYMFTAQQQEAFAIAKFPANKVYNEAIFLAQEAYYKNCSSGLMHAGKVYDETAVLAAEAYREAVAIAFYEASLL